MKRIIYVFILVITISFVKAQVNPCGKYICKMYRYNSSSVLTYICDSFVTIFYDTVSQELLVTDSCCVGGFANSPIVFNNNDSTYSDTWSGGFSYGKLFFGDSIFCY